jgi:hypothetical protein
MSTDLLSVSQLAALLGPPGTAQHISRLLYRRPELRAKCPLVGGMRLIERSLLPEITGAPCQPQDAPR